MRKTSNYFYAGLIALAPLSVFAQENTDKKGTGAQANSTSQQTDRQAQSMLLNASTDNGGPREINIGLPSDLAGTTILENGIPVTYDYQSQSGNKVWRADGSFSRMSSMNLYKTAIWNGTIGVAMASESGKGADKLGGAVTYQTNTFGLQRVMGKISSPIGKDGWRTQLSMFLNYDPSSMRAKFSRYTDKTQEVRFYIGKKYAKGEFGLQYKFFNTEGCTQWNYNPYVYHEDGTVTKYNGLKIGTTTYIESSGKLYPHNIWTGEQQELDVLKGTGSTSHIFDIMGNHTFDNNVKFNYTVRWHLASSGFLNPNTGTIFNTESQSASNRYVYVDNPDQVYTGNIQKGQSAISGKWAKWGLGSRFEFSKAVKNNKWTAGVTENFLNASNAYRSVYATYMTVEDQPVALLHQTLVNGQWTNGTSNKWGAENANSAIQYYSGFDGKFAGYIMDTWKFAPRWTIDLGGRLEWQHINGWWAPKSVRQRTSDAAGVTTMILTGREKLKKDYLNKSIAANLVWNAFRNGGFTVDAMYAQVGDNLSNYAQAVDPQVKQSGTQAYSVGVYYNGKVIDVTSKLNYIKRNNYLFAGNFENPKEVTEIERATVNYDVHTLGWTTDMNVRPFKGFTLHFLMTIQNPKYGNFKFDLFNGTQTYDYTGMVVRGVSKLLLEIDPSYRFDKFRVWASARYFSKQYACFSDALYFSPRWETFAGIDYNPSKKIGFSVNVVNLLNQTGAQGNIAGANTITKDAASNYYDKVLSGTFIRPFQIEFKTTVKF